MIKTISMAKIKNRKDTRGLSNYIGRIGRMELEGLTFEVAVVDYSKAYGHDLFEVKPRNGEGRKVVRASRLEFA